MPRVYIETSIPSFYYEVRTEPSMIARRDWTREWFDSVALTHELVSAAPVLAELERGMFPGRDEAIAMVTGLTLLPVTQPVLEIVEAYLAYKVMPANPTGDALHLALASHHGCDFLATWNCRHLANANKFDHIRRVNGIIGLCVPALVTPLELLGTGTDDET